MLDYFSCSQSLPVSPLPHPPTHTVVYVGPPSFIIYKKKKKHKTLITNELSLAQPCKKDLTLGKSASVAHHIN